MTNEIHEVDIETYARARYETLEEVLHIFEAQALVQDWAMQRIEELYAHAAVQLDRFEADVPSYSAEDYELHGFGD